jgi:hypothetical protein
LILPPCQKRQRVRRDVDHQVDLAGHDILQCRGGASIGHQRKPHAGGLLEQKAGHMGAAADARIGGRRLVGVELEPRDELAQVLRRQGRPGNDEVRVAGDERDRIEILHHVVGQCVERAVEYMGAEEPHADRVAVGRRAGDPAGAHRPAGAGDVLHDDGLPERRPHRLGQDAGQGIVRPARRQRHHNGDGPRRIDLRGCREGAGGEDDR